MDGSEWDGLIHTNAAADMKRSYDHYGCSIILGALVISVAFNAVLRLGELPEPYENQGVLSVGQAISPNVPWKVRSGDVERVRLVAANTEATMEVERRGEYTQWNAGRPKTYTYFKVIPVVIRDGEMQRVEVGHRAEPTSFFGGEPIVKQRIGQFRYDAKRSVVEWKLEP